MSGWRFLPIKRMVNADVKQRVHVCLEHITSPVFPFGVLSVAQNLTIFYFKQNLCVYFSLPFPCTNAAKKISEDIRVELNRLLNMPLEVVINTEIQSVFRHTLAGVKNIIAVSAGKGGVGKSCVTASLALALHNKGVKVGVVDGNVYGPSIPYLLGIEGKHPLSPDGLHLKPVDAAGIKVMSTGLLADGKEAKIWRGAHASDAFEQMITETLWEDVDYLLLDMPPGTGDIHLTLAQRIPGVASLLVTTPQQLVSLDVAKGLAMLERVGAPVIGIVENMCFYQCPCCDHQQHIFGDGSKPAVGRVSGSDSESENNIISVLDRLPLFSAMSNSELDSEMSLNIAQRMAPLLNTELITSSLFYRYDSRSPKLQ